MPSVLFVCAANRCRSCMAAALFRKQIERVSGAGSWQVASAGIWAPEGEPPLDNAQAVMRERGLEIGEYRSRGVSREMAQSADLVLTMEQGQKEALRAAFPEIAGRVYMLSEMGGRMQGVPDPVSGTLADFRATADEIDRLLSEGLPRIIELAGNRSS